VTHNALPHTRAYVVEQYLPGAPVREAEASVAAIEAAPPTVDGFSARLACSLLIGDDDLFLHVLVAASPEAAAKIAEAAGITPERVLTVTAWLLLHTNERTNRCTL
jgi:hypothetical protein